MLLSRLKTLITVLALSSLTLAHAAEPLKAGFVYIGPTGDHGWTYSHDQGRKMLEEQSGGKVKTAFVERSRKPPTQNAFSVIWRKRGTRSSSAPPSAT